MSNSARPPLDFIVRKEDWCRYDLEDNAILKVKLVLTRVIKVQNKISCDFTPIQVFLTNERGEPDSNTYSFDDYKNSIIKNIRFSTTTQDWNEYIVDDGTTIKTQPMVAKISKTSKFDAKGFPKYLCEVQGNLRTESPASTNQ